MLTTSAGALGNWLYPAIVLFLMAGLLVFVLRARAVARRLQAEKDLVRRQCLQLRDTGVRLEQAMSALEADILDMDVSTGSVLHSPRIRQMLGYADVELPSERAAWDAITLAEDRASAREALQAFLTKPGEEFDHSMRFRHRDGSWRWVLSHGKGEVTPGGRTVRLCGMHLDISERKRAEEQEMFRSCVLEMLVGGAPLPAILDTIVRGVEQVNPSMLCSILLLDNEHKHLLMGAAPSLPLFYSEAIDGVEIGVGVGSCGTAAFTGERVIVADIQSHPYWVLFKDLAASAGLGACWSQPIRASTGRILGTFAIYHREPHTPDPCDLSLIEQTSRLASIAIERSVAADSLRDSEERFRLLMENMPGIAVQGYVPDGRVIFWNRGSTQLYGYDATEAIGANLLDLVVPEEQREATARATRRMLETGEASPAGERILRSKSGQRVPVFSSHAVVNPQGRAPELFCLDIDLSERKRAEAALRDSDDTLRCILQTTLDGFWRMDAQGKLLDVNPAYSAQSGYSREELLEMWVFDLVLAESAAAISERLQRVMQSGHAQYESMHRRKDGSIWHVEVSATGRGAAGGQIFVFLRDITARKQAEEELRIAATAFESQEGMMVTDADGVILRVNRAFTESTGYTAQEAIGQSPRLLQSGRHSPEFYREMWEQISRNGGWQGEVLDRRKSGEVYPKWLVISAVKGAGGAVTHYIGTHYDISARKTAEEKIHTLAFFDQLTGLPNRTLLMDRLKQAMTASDRSGSYGALLFIDLDNFKTINDTLGHDVGDLLLKQIAKRLMDCVRENDTVARLGGDEFVVILENLSKTMEDAAKLAEAVGEKILVTLNQTYQFGSHEYTSTNSIGVTLFADHRESIEELLKRADLAMYQAKAAGRNTLRFFNPEMQAVVTSRAALEAGLREAVLKNQFVLHYQPQLHAGRQLIGAEVLVRWQHPQRGLISPLEFIALAEETGLILPLGQWVLDTACGQLARWARQPELAKLSMSVNVSARQFLHRDFVDAVLATLAATGADPRRLKLELTESMLISDIDDVTRKMELLKQEGISFALDDFGTGYSSLSYLKQLPLAQMKIDRSFVKDILTNPNDAAIARMLVALAGSLGLSVMAEGVETEAQRLFLADEGCHAYQGYLFSPPVPIDEFEALVANVDMAVGQ